MKIPTCDCTKYDIESADHYRLIDSVTVGWTWYETEGTCPICEHKYAQKEDFDPISLRLNFCPQCGAPYKESEETRC